MCFVCVFEVTRETRLWLLLVLKSSKTRNFAAKQIADQKKYPGNVEEERSKTILSCYRFPHRPSRHVLLGITDTHCNSTEFNSQVSCKIWERRAVLFSRSRDPVQGFVYMIPLRFSFISLFSGWLCMWEEYILFLTLMMPILLCLGSE